MRRSDYPDSNYFNAQTFPCPAIVPSFLSILTEYWKGSQEDWNKLTPGQKRAIYQDQQRMMKKQREAIDFCKQHCKELTEKQINAIKHHVKTGRFFGVGQKYSTTEYFPALKPEKPYTHLAPGRVMYHEHTIIDGAGFEQRMSQRGIEFQ